MIVYCLSPRAAVVDAAARADVDIVPVATDDGLRHLSIAGPHLVVANPLDPLEVTRALVAAGVEHGDERCVCIGLGDDSSQTAALVNAALGLAAGRHASFAALERMRDKRRLRDRLGTASPLNGRYWHVEDPAMIADILAAFPAGVVVKPLTGSGSRGVVRLSSAADLRDLAIAPPVLVEEYFDGPEYSVETLSWDGVHHALVVTEKRIGGHTGLVEIGQSQPARLPPAQTARLFAAAAAVLTAVDYRYGLSHIEFILQDDVPRLVEAHGRVGGDRIADLMQWSIGVGGFDALFRAYRDDAVASVVPTGIEASIAFVDLRTWPLSDRDWLDRVGAIDGVVEAAILRPHAERSDIMSSSDRHAHVVMAGPSVDVIRLQVHALESR